VPVFFDKGIDENSCLKNSPGTEISSLLKPLDSGKMKMYDVSTLVNTPKNDFSEIQIPETGSKLF
jgi:hypothetical protein